MIKESPGRAGSTRRALATVAVLGQPPHSLPGRRDTILAFFGWIDTIYAMAEINAIDDFAVTLKSGVCIIMG